MQRIGDKFFIKIIVIGVLLILIFSCTNHQIKDVQIIRLSEHELNINGRKAFFSLSKDYLKTEIPKIESDYTEDDNRIYFYQSQINPNNYFTIISKEDKNIPHDGIDHYIEYAKEVNNAYVNSITCTEKKILKGNSLYYLMNFYRYPFSYKEYNIDSGDSICSTFEYVTYYEDVRYHFVLYSEEHINDFSYEEKRKILESIRF